MIYGDEENERFYDEHYFRKQELRELKLLQKQEQKQFQDLAFKNQVGLSSPQASQVATPLLQCWAVGQLGLSIAQLLLNLDGVIFAKKSDT